MRVSVILVALALAPVAAGQGRKEIISKADVPAAVTKAADHAAPGTRWLVAVTWAEKDTTAYGLMGRDAKDRLVKVMAKEDGTIVDVRTTIPFTDVPAAARDALKVKMPDFKAKQTQAVGKQADKIIYYRFEGEPVDGKVTVIIASPDGKKVLPGY